MPILKYKKIELIPITSVDTESQFKIMDIRNEESVRKWMYTDHLIGANEHLKWINRLKINDKKIVFVVFNEEKKPLGVVSINDIDYLHSKADWAYFLTNTSRGGLGSALEFSILNFIFDTLQIEKINCEVIEGNNTVVKLHKKFHFQQEGFRHSNILKNDKRMGVHFLGLTKEDWLEKRDNVKEKYKSIFDKYCITIKFEPTKNTVNPIDLIEVARAKNNLNWMSVLRIALEKSPNISKLIVSEIKQIDQEISRLTEQLIDE